MTNSRSTLNMNIWKKRYKNSSFSYRRPYTNVNPVYVVNKTKEFHLYNRNIEEPGPDVCHRSSVVKQPGRRIRKHGFWLQISLKTQFLHWPDRESITISLSFNGYLWGPKKKRIRTCFQSWETLRRARFSFWVGVVVEQIYFITLYHT